LWFSATAVAVRSPLTAQGEKRFTALYGIYLLQTRQIWAPKHESSDWFHLAAPPTDLEGFNAISHAVARCGRIASVLSGGNLLKRE